MKHISGTWSDWVVRASAALGIGACLAVMALHSKDLIFWQSYFDGVQKIGSHCETAITTWQGKPEDLLGAQLAYEPRPMPHRKTAYRPVMTPDQVHVVRCRAALAQYDEHRPVWLWLGYVFGQSWIFVDDELRAISPDKNLIELPLLPKDVRRGEITVTIVSREYQDHAVGLSSIAEPFVTDDSALFLNARRFYTGYYLEQSAFYLGLAGTLLLAFLTLWARGLRYPDVFWMIAFTAQIALFNVILIYKYFTPVRPFFVYRIDSMLLLANGLTVAGFIFSAMTRRFSRPLSWSLGGFFAIGVILAVALPISWFARLGMVYDFPLYTSAFVIFAAGIAGRGVLQRSDFDPAMRRRRFWVYGSLAVIAIALNLLRAYLSQKYAMELTPYRNMILMFVFAGSILADLSDRQRLLEVEKRARAEKEREAIRFGTLATMARMLAHDLKRPFGLLAAYLAAESRDSKAAAGEPAGALRESMKASIAKHSRWIDELLDELIQLDPDATHATTHASLAECLEQIFLDAEQLGLHPTLDLRLLVHDVDVGCAPLALRRILLNLIENAFLETPRHGAVTVTTDLEADAAVIAVKNSDSFIEPHLREAIFQWDFRLRRGAGHGLGLAIARRLVTQCGGTVSCESDRAEGTTFTVRLPRRGPERASSKVLEWHRPPLTSTERAAAEEVADFLLVEDDELAVMLWRRAMKGRSHRVLSAPSELIELLDRTPDTMWQNVVVVTDHHFTSERMTAVDLVRAVRAHGITCPIYLSTSLPAALIPEKNLFTGVVEKSEEGYASLIG